MSENKPLAIATRLPTVYFHVRGENYYYRDGYRDITDDGELKSCFTLPKLRHNQPLEHTSVYSSRRILKLRTTEASVVLAQDNSASQSIASSMLVGSEVVIQAGGTDYLKYLLRVMDELSASMYAHSEESITADSARELVATIAQFSGNRSGTLDEVTDSSPCDYESQVFIPGLPPILMLGMWFAVKPRHPLVLWAKDGDVVYQQEVTADLLDICASPLLMQGAGCLACPNSTSCIPSLTGMPSPAVQEEQNVVEKLYRRLDRLPDVESVRHSLANQGGRRLVLPQGVWLPIPDRVSLAGVSFNGIREKISQDTEVKRHRKEQMQFKKSNCSGCSMSHLCGGSKVMSVGDAKSPEWWSTKDVCTGSKSAVPRVTVDNYSRVLPMLLRMLAEYHDSRCHVGVELNLLIQKLVDWVDTGYGMDRYARGLADSDREILVIPKELAELLQVMDLRGGYEDFGYRRDYSHFGAWHKYLDTRDMGRSTSNWWVITNGPHSYSNMDTLMPADSACLMLGVTPSKSGRALGTVNKRLDLVTRAILMAVVPAVLEWYGPFGSSVAHLPTTLSYARPRDVIRKMSRDEAAERLVMSTCTALLDCFKYHDAKTVALLKDVVKLTEEF